MIVTARPYVLTISYGIVNDNMTTTKKRQSSKVCLPATKKSIVVSKDVLTEQNKELRDYLKAYLKGGQGAFSILLTGAWGSGKTYFIKKIIEELKEEGEKIVYVSLNGVDSVEELERAILVAFMPTGAKVGRFALAVGRGLGVTKDWAGVDAAEIAKTIGEWVREWKGQKARKQAIVFDDIERCQMELQTWIGYVATLVEGLSSPTILIGNEAKLLENEKYRGVKEKFIGQTFHLETSCETVLPSLFREIKWSSAFSSQELQAECCKIFQMVKDTYGDANYRAFKGTLWQLKYWVRKLDGCLRECNDPRLVLHFSILFVALAYYAQLGYITEESWDKGLVDEEWGNKGGKSVKKTRKTITFLSVLLECTRLRADLFGDCFSVNHLFEPAYWKCMILTASIAPRKIVEALSQSSYFSSPRRWEKLYYYPKLETEELENGLKDLQGMIEEIAFDNEAELRMVFGLKEAITRLRYEPTDAEGWKAEQDSLFKEYTQCVDAYVLKKSMQVLQPSSVFSDNVRGHLIPGADDQTSLYRRMLRYVANKYAEAQREVRLSVLCSGNWDDIVELFNDANMHDTVLLRNDKQVISHLTEIFISAKNNKRMELEQALEKRYRVRVSNWREFLGVLSPESGVWEQIARKLKEKCEVIRGQKPMDYAKVWAVMKLVKYIEEKIVARCKELAKVETVASVSE